MSHNTQSTNSPSFRRQFIGSNQDISGIKKQQIDSLNFSDQSFQEEQEFNNNYQLTDQSKQNSEFYQNEEEQYKQCLNEYKKIIDDSRIVIKSQDEQIQQFVIERKQYKQIVKEQKSQIMFQTDLINDFKKKIEQFEHDQKKIKNRQGKKTHENQYKQCSLSEDSNILREYEMTISQNQKHILKLENIVNQQQSRLEQHNSEQDYIDQLQQELLETQNACKKLYDEKIKLIQEVRRIQKVLEQREKQYFFQNNIAYSPLKYSPTYQSLSYHSKNNSMNDHQQTVQKHQRNSKQLSINPSRKQSNRDIIPNLGTNQQHQLKQTSISTILRRSKNFK